MKIQKVMAITCTLIVVAVGGYVSEVNAFKVPSLSKGGATTSTDWGALGDQTAAALINLYTGQAELSEGVAMLAEIVDLKDEAATLRGLAESVKSCGSGSCPDIKEAQKNSDETSDLVVKKLGEVDQLTEEQKQVASDAMSKYMDGGIKYALGLKDAKGLLTQAKEAPAMQKPKFLGLINAVPVATKGATSLLKTAPTMFDIVTAKDVKYPEKKKSEMMNSLTMS